MSYIINGKTKKLSNVVIGKMYEESGLFYEAANTYWKQLNETKPDYNKADNMFMDSATLRRVSAIVKGKLEENINYITPSNVVLAEYKKWQEEYNKIVARMDEIVEKLRAGKCKEDELRSISYIESQLSWCQYVFHDLREKSLRKERLEEQQRKKATGL